MASGVILHLIRHEKTQANNERKYIGWTDEPIVKKIQGDLPISAQIVYGSDLLRCEQTAACYFPKATYVPQRDLRELNFGEFEMCTYEQLKESPIYRAWIAEPMQVVPPRGEAFTEFKQRVLQAVQVIVQKNETYTFVIHGGVIRILLAYYGCERNTFQQVIANHRTIYTLKWDAIEQFLGGAKCTSFSEEPITVNEVMSSN